MADVPRLAPPPGRGSQRTQDVGQRLQQMGLSESDAQKPLPNDLVWSPEPDDLDAELALVEQELAQLNSLELSISQEDTHVGSDPVWSMGQSFETFPEYSGQNDLYSPVPANFGALASNTTALTMQAADQTGTDGAWLQFESPFTQGAASPQQQAAPQSPVYAQAPAQGVSPVKPAPQTATGAVPKEPTHTAVFTFIPRHGDELEMKRGDPIAVQTEAPDLWFSGVNLRTKHSGIFPGHCVGDAKPQPAAALQRAGTVKPARFRVRFLGAVSVSGHRGVELMCAAIGRVMEWRKKNEVGPLKPVVLEISTKGLKMKDISDNDPKYQEEKRRSIRQSKNFEVDKDSAVKKFFFPLISVTFCSSHPKNNKLWAFVTRRKDKVFSCQVFAASQSTQPLTVAMGRAFKQLQTDFVEHAAQET